MIVVDTANCPPKSCVSHATVWRRYLDVVPKWVHVTSSCQRNVGGGDMCHLWPNAF